MVTCNAEAAALRRREEQARVEHELLQMCRSLRVGDKVPTHTELMQRFSASERTVLRALERLTQRRIIIRKHGSGTYIAPTAEDQPLEEIEAANQSVIGVIARFDHSIFRNMGPRVYRCMRRLNVELQWLPLVDGRLPGTLIPHNVVVFGYDLLKQAAMLQAAGKRVVVTGTPPLGQISPLPCITGDHHGADRVISHLYDLGHRNIAVISSSSGPPYGMHWYDLTTFSTTLDPHDSVSVNLVPLSRAMQWHRDRECVRSFFCYEGAPTAVVVCNDDVAITIMSTLQWAGISVPDDVSVVGYGAEGFGEFAHPSLTTVDPHLDEVMSLAAEMLLTNDRTALPMSTVVVPTLVVRQSSAAVRTMAYSV